MSKYVAKIRFDGESFFAMVVRVDRDGFEQVDATFKARHFATHKAAEKATAKHIAKG